VRPGRIDFKVEYKRASQAQAHKLFDRFFPADRFGQPGVCSADSSPPSYDIALNGLAPPETKAVEYDEGVDSAVPTSLSSASPRARYPYRGTLSRSLAELGDTFATSVPPHEFSAAELQGYLLLCKWDPERAADNVMTWVEEERSQRRAKEEREERRKERARAKAAQQLAGANSTGQGMSPAMAMRGQANATLESFVSPGSSPTMMTHLAVAAPLRHNP
jgi:chaperone BCS1